MNKMEIVDIKSGLPVQIPSLGVLNPTQENEFDKIIPIIEINTHAYLVGSTKSGKTEFAKLIYMRKVLQKDSSIVIFDPHGDLAQECAKMMNEKDDIIYIDPTLKKGLTPTINPFRIKKK